MKPEAGNLLYLYLIMFIVSPYFIALPPPASAWACSAVSSASSQARGYLGSFEEQLSK
jgi:hypothetical protein